MGEIPQEKKEVEERSVYTRVSDPRRWTVEQLVRDSREEAPRRSRPPSPVPPPAPDSWSFSLLRQIFKTFLMAGGGGGAG